MSNGHYILDTVPPVEAPANFLKRVSNMSLNDQGNSQEQWGTIAPSTTVIRQRPQKRTLKSKVKRNTTKINMAALAGGEESIDDKNDGDFVDNLSVPSDDGVI